jgi:3-dehydroquinate synthase
MEIPFIPVRTASAEYAVWCASGTLAHVAELVGDLKDCTGTFFLSSPRVWKLWGRSLAENFPVTRPPHPILFDDGESAKQLATVEKICRSLVRAGADRHAVLVALGGGVVGDVAGFAAASYLRGVRLVHVPTTLMAQVDSAIGGKTGVNLPEGKNLIGAFYQPAMVVADFDVLRTLPDRQYRSGLYEVIKYAVIGDADLFEFLESRMDGLLSQKPDALEWAVPRCIRIKADIVGRDERENGLRRILNFGHTIGHALEAATNYRRFLHGEAVGWGMLGATRIARETGALDKTDAARIDRLVCRVGHLPPVRGIAMGRILKALRADKKSRAGQIGWVLPRRIGQVEIGAEVPEVLVRRILAQLAKLPAAARSRS